MATSPLRSVNNDRRDAFSSLLMNRITFTISCDIHSTTICPNIVLSLAYNHVVAAG